MTVTVVGTLKNSRFSGQWNSVPNFPWPFRKPTPRTKRPLSHRPYCRIPPCRTTWSRSPATSGTERPRFCSSNSRGSSSRAAARTSISDRSARSRCCSQSQTPSGTGPAGILSPRYWKWQWRRLCISVRVDHKKGDWILTSVHCRRAWLSSEHW